MYNGAGHVLLNQLLPLFKKILWKTNSTIIKNEFKLLGPFFEDLTEIQPYIWREVHPILQHMLSFLHQFSVCVLMKTNKWIKK